MLHVLNVYMHVKKQMHAGCAGITADVPGEMFKRKHKPAPIKVTCRCGHTEKCTHALLDGFTGNSRHVRGDGVSLGGNTDGRAST